VVFAVFGVFLRTVWECFGVVVGFFGKCFGVVVGIFVGFIFSKSHPILIQNYPHF
jgi:hypothetical protein